MHRTKLPVAFVWLLILISTMIIIIGSKCGSMPERKVTDEAKFIEHSISSRDPGPSRLAGVARRGRSLILYYESGQVELSATQLTKLIENRDQWERAERLTIEGHTDSEGSEESNRELSRQRVMQVTDLLVDEFGVKSDKIETLSYGEERPIDTNEDPKGRAKNRRVEVSEGVSVLSYYWNAWTDVPKRPMPEPSYDPVPFLEPCQKKPCPEYLVSLHLAGKKYSNPDVRTYRVQRKFEGLVEQARSQPRKDRLSLDVVILNDPRFIVTQSRLLTLDIDVERIANFDASEGSDEVRAMSDFKAGVDPDYFFGDVRVRVQTTKNVGPTALGVSLWYRGRPYDELSIPFCVRYSSDPPCSSKELRQMTLAGSALFDIGSEQPARRPDASIHLIQIAGRIVGVFHRNDRPVESVEDYVVWTAEENKDRFLKEMLIIQENFGTTGNMDTTGRDLANLMFGGRHGEEARTALEGFVADHRVGDAPFGENNKTIFVRMIVEPFEQPAIYPLGLLNLDGKDEFLGYWFRLDSPLPRQSYSAEGSCLASWIPVLPTQWTQDTALKDAVNQLGTRIETDPLNGKLTLRIGERSFSILDEMRQFREWIGPSRGKDRITDQAVVTVISHHDANSLYFNKKQDGVVHSASITRDFRQPSIAILGGCSTGVGGAAGIVDKLNLHGIDSVIVTNTGISGRLAGHFLECLTTQLEGSSENTEVGRLFVDSQRCLHGRYGSQALSFTMAGNPNLKICTSGEF